MTTLLSRPLELARRHFPTREQLQKNRYLRPFAHRVLRSDLWRFNRRSVPRGIALGLFVGVLIPFAHSFVAALTAVFVRANVPVAIASTWTSNPATWVIIFPAAYKLGKWLMHVDAATGVQPLSGTLQTTQAGHFLQQLTGATVSTALGLFIIASVLAFVGYVATTFGWRVWVARKRQRRTARAAARLAAAAAAE